MTETPDRSARSDTPPPAHPYSAYPGPNPDPNPAFPPPQQETFQSYGYPPGPYPGSYPPPPMPYGDYPGGAPTPRNGLGIAALPVGVLGLLGSFFVVGIIPGVAAAIMGLVARGRAKHGEATNGGVALAGVIVGVLAVIASLIFAAFWVGLFNEVGAGDYLDCLQQAGQDRTLVQECSDRFQESVESKFSITPTP